MTSSHAVLFPLFLKLEGRACLVVGANHETEGKIYNLLASGAKVRVIAAEGTDGVRELAETGQIVWEQRKFTPDDLTGVTLVIALDEDDAVNEQIYRESTARGVLCNIVDQPERCHFYYPAVVRRGHLQIAISTGGLSPALASEIRRDLDEQFDSLYAEWIEAVGRARARVLREWAPSPRRTRLLKRIATRRAFQNFSAKRNQQSKQEQL